MGAQRGRGGDPPSAGGVGLRVRVGCGVDEADEALKPRFTRRQLLGAATAFAAAATTAVPAAAEVGPHVTVQPKGQTGRHRRLGDRRTRVCLLPVAPARHPGRLRVQHRPRRRIRTLRGYFADGQLVEEHAEFINPEHTKTLALAKSFGLTLDNTTSTRPGHTPAETMKFFGQKLAPGLAHPGLA